MIIFPKGRNPLKNLGKLPDQEKRKVGDGMQGNLDTIQIMKKMARQYSTNPLVRTLATNIIDQARIPSHQYLEEARAIGQWVQQNVRYTRDTDSVETIHAPDMMIKHLQDRGYIGADCDDMSLLIATLLLSVGIRPKFRAVRYRADSGPYNHIYVVVYENNITDSLKPGAVQRLVLDAIIKDKPMGFEIPHQSGKEFEV